MQDLLQIQGSCSFRSRSFLYFQKIRSSNQLIQCLHTKSCHIFSQILCNEPHKVHHIFRLSGKSLSKFRILHCHTDRTGVQIAYPHHNTAKRYQRSRGKSEFLCTKDCRNRHITSAHQLSVGLDSDSFPKAILYQRLMSFRKSQFPWKSRIMDRTSRRRTGSSVITGDQDQPCTCFCNTGSNGTDTCL